MKSARGCVWRISSDVDEALLCFDEGHCTRARLWRNFDLPARSVNTS